MTENAIPAGTSDALRATSVADYIVQRLAAEGIAHCFGVAGDYAFPLCDAVDRSPDVKWIGCSNELNASYAADGYARIRGAAILVTTYAVGELSALNGVMGANAERSLIFHLVGMPSYQNQRLGKIAHHTLGDGIFGNFVNISAQSACCHAVINPDNCIIELERVRRRSTPQQSARLHCRSIRLCVIASYAGEGSAVGVQIERSLRQGRHGCYHRAIANRQIYCCAAGLYHLASRIAEAGAECDRSPGLSICHDLDGKMYP